ncbi:MAG: hypothetical protein KDB38_08415 [Nocardioidaceae bacterium]|nr:hypothetical protein [Nocardioidaceae bacterium]MCB8993500.1 hypothetical protein [Nocardioidaceae bacterium]
MKRSHPCRTPTGATAPGDKLLRRLWKPLVAATLGVFLLTGGLDTLALWGTTNAIGTGNLTAGALNISGGTTSIELHSQITVGQRSFVSGTTCATTAPYTECRKVTATLGTERLVPGDKLTITRQIAVTASGDNLQGDLMVDLSEVLPNTGGACPGDQSNSYACAATISASVTKPDNSTTAITSGTGWVLTLPVSSADGSGSYQVTWTMAVPPDDAGADLLARLTNKAITFGAFDLTLSQT